MSARKVSPGLKDWVLAYASRDLEGFKAFAAAVPALAGVHGAVALGIDDVGGKKLPAAFVVAAARAALSGWEVSG